MSIIGIDFGSSTTKMIEFENNEIKNKKILQKIYDKNDMKEFLIENNINFVEKIVFTGIHSNEIDKSIYNVPVEIVDEFRAIATGGTYLSKKEKIIIASIGTGTALIEVNNGNIKHLGGTGLGAGTLFNFCDRFLNINNFNEIMDLVPKGNINKIDLRISDVTNKQIETLPKELTLSNFGKFEKDAKREDILLGIVNMIFETIGMMIAFSSINSDINEAVLIGNITVIPGIQNILKKIEFTHKIKFFIPKNSEYGVALGAVLNTLM